MEEFNSTGPTKGFAAKSEDEKRREENARYRNQRADERYYLDVPGGSLNYRGIKLPCQVIDVSLGGCCIRLEERFLPGNLAHVEVVLPIHGMYLHMVGITQWISQENLIGIRFIHASSRSKNQLAGLLTCLVDESAAEIVTEAVVAAAEDPMAPQFLDIDIPEAVLQKIRRASTPGNRRESQPTEPPFLRATAPIPPSSVAEPFPESPAHSEKDTVRKSEKEDWSVLLRVLKDGSRIMGTITGLRLDGCSMEFASPFALDTKIRAEVEFQLCGIPLRLAALIEAVHNKQSADVRFLEMSRRRQGELAELLDELREMGKGPSKSS